jgi:hypothetical protein
VDGAATHRDRVPVARTGRCPTQHRRRRHDRGRDERTALRDHLGVRHPIVPGVVALVDSAVTVVVDAVAGRRRSDREVRPAHQRAIDAHLPAHRARTEGVQPAGAAGVGRRLVDPPVAVLIRAVADLIDRDTRRVGLRRGVHQRVDRCVHFGVDRCVPSGIGRGVQLRVGRTSVRRDRRVQRQGVGSSVERRVAHRARLGVERHRARVGRRGRVDTRVRTARPLIDRGRCVGRRDIVPRPTAVLLAPAVRLR